MADQNEEITSPESRDGLTISQRFKLLRGVNKMNQQEFARFIGISQSQVSAIESNVRNPSRKLLQVIASKCNCSVLWLGQGITYTDIIKKENDTFKREEKERIIGLLEKMNTEALYYLRRQAELIYNLQIEKENQSNIY